MKRVGLIGWRGMVGSVLMGRMKEEKDFDQIDPVFFTTSNPGGKGPDIGKDVPPLKDAKSVDELKAMEGLAKTHDLYEVHAIEPVLQAIVDDPAVMDLARKKARHLLELAAAENAAGGDVERGSKMGGPN